MPGANKLKDRVRFERRRVDANGDRLGAWEAQYACWAETIYLRGSEQVVAARLEGRQPVVFVIRDCQAARAISPAYRAVDQRLGTEFNITGIAPSREAGFIEVQAFSGGASG